MVIDHVLQKTVLIYSILINEYQREFLVLNTQINNNQWKNTTMKDNDNIINNEGHRVDASGRVITEDGRTVVDNASGDPEYFEEGNRERIIDDNARRMADPDVVERKVVTNDPSNIDRSHVKEMSKETRHDLNADIITGEPGSHPIGTAVGGVGGAVAGAAIGSIAGPLGTLIGGAIGAIAGGGAGHASAEAIDPTHEEAYWRAEYANADYYKEGHDFDRDMHPAYAVGYANRARYPQDARFEDHEADLQRSWEDVKGESDVPWDYARMASRDAWNRVS